MAAGAAGVQAERGGRRAALRMAALVPLVAVVAAQRPAIEADGAGIRVVAQTGGTISLDADDILIGRVPTSCSGNQLCGMAASFSAMQSNIAALQTNLEAAQSSIAEMQGTMSQQAATISNQATTISGLQSSAAAAGTNQDDLGELTDVVDGLSDCLQSGQLWDEDARRCIPPTTSVIRNIVRESRAYSGHSNFQMNGTELPYRDEVLISAAEFGYRGLLGTVEYVCHKRGGRLNSGPVQIGKVAITAGNPNNGGPASTNLVYLTGPGGAVNNNFIRWIPRGTFGTGNPDEVRLVLRILRFYECIVNFEWYNGTAYEPSYVQVYNPSFERPALAPGESSNIVVSWDASGPGSGGVVHPPFNYPRRNALHGRQVLQSIGGRAFIGVSRDTVSRDYTYRVEVHVLPPISGPFGGYVVQICSDTCDNDNVLASIDSMEIGSGVVLLEVDVTSANYIRGVFKVLLRSKTVDEGAPASSSTLFDYVQVFQSEDNE